MGIRHVEVGRGKRKVFEELEVFPADVLSGPADCATAIGVEMIERELAEHATVVIAPDDDVTSLSDEFDALVWLCPVTHDISQALDVVRVEGVNDIEGALKCGEVSVDVGEDCDAHLTLRTIRNNVRNKELKR